LTNYAEFLFFLPYEFIEEYKNEEGIIKADDLHSLILELVDVDKHKETLINIVKYKAKYKLLQELSEFRFNSEYEYNKENYEYKILDLACKELEENDYQKFRDKVVIEVKGKDLKLSEIPPFTDTLQINDYKLNIAKILPDNYEYSDHLNIVINKFSKLGVDKERIGKLFGMSKVPEPSNIFQMFCKQIQVLDNAEQLAFLFLYGLYIEKIDFNQFKAINTNEEEVELGYDIYLTDFDFIDESQILHKKYIGIKKIFKEFPILIEDNDNLLLMEEPFFEGNRFICPYIKEDLSDVQKLNFVEFLFNNWIKKDILIKDINWSTISTEWSTRSDVEIATVLGFNPRTSVYPSKYACKNEVLPAYLIKWINEDDTRINFLSDLGVWTENSVVLELRKYLSNEIKNFHYYRLTQETRFDKDKTNLFNSFLWLKEEEITLKTSEQYETFKKTIDFLNENRTNYGNIKIIEEFNFQDLAKNSREWKESFYEKWKENSEISIFLYTGELPKIISIDKIDEYVFYYFNEGNIVLNNFNSIYINCNTNIYKELQKLALDCDDINLDNLWHNKIDFLEKEKAELEEENALLKKTSGVILSTKLNTDISKKEQEEANREAKEIVKEKLEKEGFAFTDGIGDYSIINGVYKEDVEFPLVVKSYIYQDEPLKIGLNEWSQLMRPNSMFWLHFGNRNLGCLKLHKFLRSQDKLTISFSTENLDLKERLDKFTELLHFFSNVHFDFYSINPEDYSVTKKLSDYRFDERTNETDLSADDESLL
jgi:hypothetical protein